MYLCFFYYLSLCLILLTSSTKLTLSLLIDYINILVEGEVLWLKDWLIMILVCKLFRRIKLGFFKLYYSLIYGFGYNSFSDKLINTGRFFWTIDYVVNCYANSEVYYSFYDFFIFCFSKLFVTILFVLFTFEIILSVCTYVLTNVTGAFFFEFIGFLIELTLLLTLCKPFDNKVEFRWVVDAR